MGSETKMIKYSFIIPHHNSPELLNRCINSIPKREDIEVIVVDDNSDDNKKPFFNHNVSFVFIDKNGSRGAGKARNVGIEHARGTWLLFADADDYYVNGFIDILDKELDDSLDVLYFNISSDISKATARGNIINYNYNRYFGTDKQSFIKFGIWAPWNKVSKRVFVKGHNLHYEERLAGNDQYFNLSLSQEAKTTKIINDVLYILTDQCRSTTFGHTPSLNRYINGLELCIQRDDFFKRQGLNSLRKPLLVLSDVWYVYRFCGIKGLIKYLSLMNHHRCIFFCMIDCCKYHCSTTESIDFYSK